MAVATLISPDQTALFSAQLACALITAGCPPLLLSGPLGCGKTTLTGFLCRALPGGHEAEIASPSFTIYNLYPCEPPVMHCDFYRCPDEVPEDLWAFLEDEHGLAIVEWPGDLRFQLHDFLDISFNVANHARELNILATGKRSASALAALARHWDLK